MGADASRARSFSPAARRGAHAGMKMFFIFTLNGARAPSSLMRAHIAPPTR
jgi:hypothetical protein